MPIFHATPSRFDEDRLVPRTRNVALDADGSSARLSDYDETNPPYVFAAVDEGFAATYAVPKGIRLGNYIGLNDVNILLVDKESLIGDPSFTGGLYSFSDTGFVPLFNRQAEATGQMVSNRHIDLAAARFEPIANLNDVMRKSIQIFQIGENFDSDGFDARTRGLNDADFLNAIHSMADSGDLRWLNQERGIMPIAALLHSTTENHQKPRSSYEERGLKL